ncbi:transposase family protein [Exiguobacterium sp. s55]|uniref:transposase family protein n=1 Tax=Exiguobacterium sp. s55 TaxID=2751245 RepID=UPI001BE8ECE2|nr:transposase family protein [Exiguobacterium sp. s55]
MFSPLEEYFNQLDPNLRILQHKLEDHKNIFVLEQSSSSSVCPCCHRRSYRAHSRYTRCVKDLPIINQPVELLILTRKWFCVNPSCHQKVFAERYNWLYKNGQRTSRLEAALETLAFSTSCLQAEKVAKRLHMPVSHDALLKIIHRSAENTDDVSPFRPFG